MRGEGRRGVCAFIECLCGAMTGIVFGEERRGGVWWVPV